jgi:hypothetical protein
MSEKDVNEPVDSRSGQQTPEAPNRAGNEQPYLYRHAGIEERDGRIPLWLTLVVVGLLLWSIYYAVQYWSPD